MPDFVAQVSPPSVLMARKGGLLPAESPPTAVQIALEPLPVQLVALKAPGVVRPVTDFIAHVAAPSVLVTRIGKLLPVSSLPTAVQIALEPLPVQLVALKPR